MQKQFIQKVNWPKAAGWVAVGISAFFANLWAYWGIIENFHEGWYFPSFWDNILMMFGQYLLATLGFMLLAFISIKWPKIGALLHLLLAGGAYWLFGNMSAGFMLVVIPLLGLATLYWFAKLERKKLAYFLTLGLPLLLILSIGTPLAIRVAHRYNDQNFQTRAIQGNGVELIWAPQGPGWPDNGTSWYEAQRTCAYLNEDGKTLSDRPLNIWRLPTVDEAVRSQVYHGQNAGGAWDPKTKKAVYQKQPDKESPLWNMHLKTIYWWTATEVNKEQAYIIVYNGTVWPRMKSLKAGYLNFRAVKENFKQTDGT